MTPETPDLRTIVTRLHRLERANRFLKAGWLVLLVGLVSNFVMEQVSAQNGTVVAQRFELVDADGTRRGAWATTGGEAGLVLSDANGTPRWGVGVVDEVAGLQFRDAAGTMRAEFSAGDIGTLLTLFDASGINRAGLGVMPDGAPSLQLSDATATIRVVLGVVADGQPTFALLDANSKPIASLP